MCISNTYNLSFQGKFLKHHVSVHLSLTSICPSVNIIITFLFQSKLPIMVCFSLKYLNMKFINWILACSQFRCDFCKKITYTSVTQPYQYIECCQNILLGYFMVNPNCSHLSDFFKS